MVEADIHPLHQTDRETTCKAGFGELEQFVHSAQSRWSASKCHLMLLIVPSMKHGTVVYTKQTSVDQN